MLVDPQTGVVSNEWFRFFNNLYSIIYAATGNVTPGTYGSATVVPQITVDAFGAITAITDVTIALDASQIVSGTIASARISGSYTGITGVGTLTIGTWNATAITTLYGGTGLSSYTAGDTLYYASGTALSNLAIGASTYINTSSGTAPQWTDPSTITIGKATNIVGGAANRIAYQTATDTTGFIVAPTVSNTYLEWSGTAFQWTANPLGTVTSVAALTLGTTGTDLSSTVANPTTTPVITLNVPTASAANRGALSAADWTTFNSKAPGVTFTTNYIPYGQGTTTLNQSANLTFDGTNLSVAGAVNKVTITSPATGSTLTIANGKTLTANNTLTLAGTDSTTMTFPTTSATIARTDAAQTFTGIQTFGTTASTGNYISVLGSDADNTYLVFSGARKYPRLDLTDTVAGGSTFQIWNLGNQLRFGTNTGSAGTASFYINSGNAGTAVFNGALTAASFIPSSSTVPTNGLYLPAANTLGWATASTARMQIGATGGVSIGNTTDPGATNLSVTGTGQFGTTVGVGAATPSASGAGITFPATQSASTNVNTLDDYEEGTFTPTIIGTTSAGTGTYSANSQIGRYTKIGNRVYFTIYLVWTAHTGTGNMSVAGLPFTSIATAGTFNALSTWYQNITMTALNLLAAYVNLNATIVSLSQTPVGGGAATAVAMDTAGSLMLTGHYEVA
jgi:hypothetical protein